MSLDKKSQENLKVAEYCLNVSNYNAAASRVYYAVYQRIKNYLVIEQSESDTDKIPEYKHGRIIKKTLANYLSKNGKSSDELMVLNDLERIYQLRIKADYFHAMVVETELRPLIQNSKKIIAFINSL